MINVRIDRSGDVIYKNETLDKHLRCNDRHNNMAVVGKD